MIKKILKFLGILLLGFILALAVMPLVFEEEIKEGIQQAINEEVNARVEFSDIGLSFFRSFPDASIKIDELSVIGINEFEGDTLAFSETIDFTVSIPSIIKKSTPLLIKGFSIDKAILDMKVDNNLNNNYLIFKEGNESSEYTVELEKYSVTESNLKYNNEFNNIALYINDINHTGSGRFTESLFDLNTKTTTPDLTVTSSGIPMLKNARVSADAIIEVAMQENKYTFRENEIILNALPFNMDGVIQLQDGGTEMNLDFLAPDADFKEIFSLIPYAYSQDYRDAQITGEGAIEASITGLLADDESSMPSVSIKLDVMNGSVKYPLLSTTIQEITTSASIKASGVNYENLEMDIPSFSMKARDSKLSGRLSVTGPISNQSIDMGLMADVNLQTWKDAFPMEETSDFKGTVTSDFTLKGTMNDIRKKNWKDVIFDGYFNGENIVIESTDIPTIAIKKLSSNADPKLLEVGIEELIFQGSDFNIDASLDYPLNYLSGTTLKGAATIKSNKVNSEDFMSSSGASSQDPSFIIPSLNMDVNWYAQQVLSPSYNINNIILEGSIEDDLINVKRFQAFISDQQVNATGSFSGINQYLMNKGDLNGDITINSPSINTAPLLTENSVDGDSNKGLLLPENVNINIDANIASLDHGSYQLKDLIGFASLKNGTLEIEQIQSSTLGGKIVATGSYSTFSDGNDQFDFKIDLSQIGFQNAVKSSPLFKYLAPVADYITGYFNATLMMNSEVGLNYSPIYNTLDASGFIETRDGRIQGFGPLSSLGNKLGVEKISDWAIENSKNWFEVVDGMVELKDHKFDIGQGMSLTIGGKHGLGRNMNYELLLEIPRSLLKKNVISGTLEYGLSEIEKQATRLGMDISQGDYLLLNINMNGNIQNPSFKITPLGSTEKRLDEMAEDQLKDKVKEIEDKINSQIDSTKGTIKDTINVIKKDIQDSITKVIDKKVDAAKDSLSKIIDKKQNQAIDSLLNKTGLDSIATEPIDILKEKAGKEIEDIKKKLEKWKPLSAKKKEKKDTIPGG
ncbi:MAG: hypothetical protein HKN68_09545 [Saprospiraceae bacterium]|nr:hypothetical protein [Saprospiraceae bacterium]